MNKLARWYWIARGLGWENVPRRVWFLAQRKLGAERRALPLGEMAAEKWRDAFTPDYRAEQAAERWRERARGFFIDPERAPAMRDALHAMIDETTWRTQVTEQVERLSQGEVKFFDHRYWKIGTPARFNYDPIHDAEWPSGVPASAIDQLDPRRQDIKCVWEASRFSVAFALAREHVRDPESPAAELFWKHFETWDAQNPYGLSVNWNCSQEASFRLMAWLFAASAMLDSEYTTPARLHRLTQLIWYTARQVSFNINYARSQKNNHALSEAVALLTVGLMFPEFRAAPRWLAQGRRVLIAETRRQIYDDGSYVQHSMNYHRVMLDVCLWAIRLGELHGERLPEVRAKVSLALDWLLEMIDPYTGRVPNYGPNDGAHVLQLSCCDYLDYRPVALLGSYLLKKGVRSFAPGAWDEKALWLCGPEVAECKFVPHRRSPSFAAKTGGYYTFSGDSTWGMIRACKYHDRPHQADMLHLDLWCNGVNILRDGGTYHYNCPAPWKHFFESTAAHNTVEVDGQDQMVRGPRFLWFYWVKGELLTSERDPEGPMHVAARHFGYQRLSPGVTHERLITWTGVDGIVEDRLIGAGNHRVALRWRLCAGEWRRDGNSFQLRNERCEVTISFESLPSTMTVELLCGQEIPHPEGWESLYYADRQPVPTIVVSGEVETPLTLITHVEVRAVD